MTQSNREWFEQLSDEDHSFIKRFLLASGSLKQLAKDYGISYPTVRLRLDRVIDKVRLLDSQENPSEFEKMLRLNYAEGKIDMPLLKSLLQSHQAEVEAAAAKE